MRAWGLTLGFALLACDAARLAAQESARLPPGVMAADTAAGNGLFHGVGGCSVCHGETGIGADDAGYVWAISRARREPRPSSGAAAP